MNLKNLVYTELTGTPYTDSATSITVSDGTVFSSTPFEATIYNKRKNPGVALNDGEAEIVEVTNVSTNTLTVTRGQGGTSAIALGSGTDWAIIQSATKAVFDGKVDYAEADTGVVIDFTQPKIFNSKSSEGTGNITDNLTGAKIGVVQKIYHNDSSEPTVPAGWVKLNGSQDYVINSTNIIFAEWESGTRVEYWIVQEA